MHEQLDEQGYFAPAPDVEEHVAPDELSPRRSAIKSRLRIAVYAALLAALVCACVYWLATYLPFMQLYK